MTAPQGWQPEAGQTFKSEQLGIYVDYSLDGRGDPTVEEWRFVTEDSGSSGSAWLELRVHEIVETSRSGKLVVYYRQWVFAPDEEPEFRKARKRAVSSVASFKALVRRRSMTRFVDHDSTSEAA